MSGDLELIDKDIEGFLAKHESKELLRFVTIGSVDDGKSTLIGRLLFDTGNVFEDHLAAITKRSADGKEEIDLANLTDGLQAEREQGITIDVAYRYFATEKRKFIIADSPGHVQYTRNMATGASNAHVGIILIDARLGVLQQTRRHATIASLLGIQHLLVAINKIDLKNWSQATFKAIRHDLQAVIDDLGFASVACIPTSALEGDNIVTRSEHMSWYEGQTVLEYLESVPVPAARSGDGFVLPVQVVLRPDLHFRGYAGTLASGIVHPGDQVTILPSGLTSRVGRIVTMGGDLDEAFAPQSVTITLQDEIDISRGDVIVGGDHGLEVARRIEAEVVWLADQPLQPGQQYLIKHTSRTVSGAVDQVHHRLNMDTLEDELCTTLELNDVGRVTLGLNRPLVCSRYSEGRETGSFIIIDRLSNATLGAGMIVGSKHDEQAGQIDLKRRIPAEERAERFNQQPSVVWISGRHGIGKMEVAHLLERKLFDAGHLPYALDLYRLPRIAIPAFGEDVHRILDHLDQCLEMGYVTIMACTVPMVADRRRARAHLLKRLPVGALVDCYLEAPREACLRRITADGRDQRLCDITYEEPTTDIRPDLRVDAEDLQTDDVERIVDQLLGLLQERRLIR